MAHTLLGMSESSGSGYEGLALRTVCMHGQRRVKNLWRLTYRVR